MPTALTDVKVNRPFGLAYADGYVYYTDYDQGLFKISTSTFQLTHIAEANPKLIAVAVDSQGDLFYAASGSNSIYKIDHQYLDSTMNHLPYSSISLEDISELYYEAPSSLDAPQINGLAFDRSDRLYMTIQDENYQNVPSKILRLNAGSNGTPTLVTNFRLEYSA